MPAQLINIPNLATRLSEIDSIVAGILASAPTILQTFIDPKFIFKGSADCSTFYLDDQTDYSSVDVADVTINASVIWRNACGDRLGDCSVARSMTPSGRLEFTNEFGDGQYCAIIDISYFDPIGMVTYTDRIEKCLYQACCHNKILDLKNDVHKKMAHLMSTINNYAKIGRKPTKLWQSLYKLSNIYYVLCNTKHGCNEYEILACIVSEVKTFNC